MTDRNDNKTNPPSQRRFHIFIAIFAILGLGVLVRYGVLMLSPSGSTGNGNTGQPFVERGPILDRNGRILAIQTRLGNITIWRPDIEDQDVLSRDLAPILNMSPELIKSKIDSGISDFVYLKKQAEQSTIREIENLKAEGRLRGVGIEAIVGRIYPEKRLASQIIGFVGNENNNGLGGIEYAFESELSPPEAKSRGGSGNQVFLTIDANVQHILEEIAERTRLESRAEAVMFIAMDPRSGDILGSASLPNFDPNDINSSSELSRMDRPAIWSYEPGSVFKVFSISALMESGAVGAGSTFLCDGHYERVTNRGERIVISCLSAHGRVTARDIITYSCNAGAAYAADRLSATPFYDLLQNYGFGTRTGAGSPGETVGFLRSVDRWSERSKPTIALGQEIAVSALQMVQAATAVANDGVLVPPRIVSRIVSPKGEIIRSYEGGQGRRVLKAEVARAMRSYMVDVTSEIGTGWRANIRDLSLAVKTGTAQLIDPVTKGYSDTDFVASCIALLPAESPSLILYLAIIKPKGEILGGRIAAPPIREAAETLVDYLGIPRGRNPQISHSGSISLPQVISPIVDTVVPNFGGYSKRELLPLLLRDDLHLEISGNGWVSRQSPAPGTPLNEDTVIVLELE
ncbi:penicillin-binding protein [Treponema primitia ZAS-2]|uniref:Penicillin-binding protein n=1 Tax=Treponema primitia (strain ATCC BAA-887 / DSM 12427 / ZAS-2) TaxID=545694 RepID=F5YIJ4_TREPZ|nr:penicillin-binding transpeptidase domain-containing protein [Treponema primitia]AEF85321.1 penicillin-binding protein [Treponema primitia ZAS-2]